MNHKYSILQLTNVDDLTIRNKMYMPFEFVKDKFIIWDYDKVYEGTIEGEEPIEILERLFEIFNLRHPEDFHGHSLSVSDVVKLDDKFYYCDSTGWKIV